MASTYSPNLAIELIATGEQAGTWSVTTNTNLGTLIEQSISGYVTQAITDGSGANTTITIPDGATGVARNMTIEMTGALTFSTTSLIVPANKKLYFIFNNTSGGFAVTVKVSGQTGILVPNGKKVVLTSNGTDIVEAHTAIVGNATMGGTLGITGTTTAAAINASGLVAMAGAATVGTTLGVTGTSSMAAINASGLLTVNRGGSSDAFLDTHTAAGGGITSRSTTTGSINAAAIFVDRGDQANGFAQFQSITGGNGSTGFASGLRSGDSSFHIYDNAATTDRLTITTAGAVTIPGTLGVTTRINAGNNAQTTYPLEVGGVNGNGIRYRDSTNTVDVFAGAFNSRAIVGAITNHALDLYANNAAFLSSTAAGAVTIPGNTGIGGAPGANLFQLTNASVNYAFGYNGTSVTYYDVDTHYFRTKAGTQIMSLASGATSLTGTLGVTGQTTATGNLLIGSGTIQAWAGPVAKIGSRTYLGQLNVNSGSYLTSNLYFDGTNWRTEAAAGGGFLSVIGDTLDFQTSVSGGALGVGTIVSRFAIASGGAVSIPGTLGVTGGVTSPGGFSTTYAAASNANNLSVIQTNAGGNSLDTSALFFMENRGANPGFVQQNNGTTTARISVAGSAYFAGTLDVTATTTITGDVKAASGGQSVLALFGANISDRGGGNGILVMANATSPGSSYAGGGLLYVQSGALRFRGSSGTVTVIAPA